jgi:hypothetical protein
MLSLIIQQHCLVPAQGTHSELGELINRLGQYHCTFNLNLFLIEERLWQVDIKSYLAHHNFCVRYFYITVMKPRKTILYPLLFQSCQCVMLRTELQIITMYIIAEEEAHKKRRGHGYSVASQGQLLIGPHSSLSFHLPKSQAFKQYKTWGPTHQPEPVECLRFKLW